MNPDACNFDPEAVCDNNLCVASGCIIPGACNYDATAGCNNLSCNFEWGGILFSDNFENYTSNFGITQQSVNWALWQPSSNDALPSNIAATGGNQSMLLDGINNHLLLRTQDYYDGIIDLSFDISVLQSGASVSLLRTYTSPTQVERGLTLIIDGDNLLNVVAGDTSLINGASVNNWIHFTIQINLHSDTAFLTMNGDTLAQWSWSAFDVTGLPGNNAFAGIELRGMNTTGNSAQFLIDEISISYTDYHDCAESCIHDIDSDGICDEYQTTPTLIKEISEENFTLYPNPTAGIIYVRNNKNSIAQKIIVRDLTGRIITVKSNVNAIDLSEFSDGTYLIHVVNNLDHKVWKILKEK